MDDGLQFANEDRSNWPAGPDATKTIYKAGYHTFQGTHYSYIGNDKAGHDAVIAKLEAENARFAAMKGWKPSAYEIISEIIEPTTPVVEEVESAPQTSEAIEQVEASTASTNIPQTVQVRRPAKAGAFSAREMTALAMKDRLSRHLDWNKRTERDEGLVDGKRLCVEGAAFQAEMERMQEAAPTDDEYRIWGVATWVRTWIDRAIAGNTSSVYFEEVR